LALAARDLQRARAALLLIREDESGIFRVASAWPDPTRDLKYLGPVAQQVLDRREGLVCGTEGAQSPGSDGAAFVGYPLVVADRLHGAVVVDIGPGPVEGLQSALRRLHWASAWLVDHFRAALLQRRDAELARSALLNEVLATAMQFDQLEPSALAVAHDLSARFTCDRVCVGFEDNGQVIPRVMSNTASFDRRSDLVRWLAEAMDEVLDLGLPVQVPAPPDGEFGALAHAEVARQLTVQALLSVPIRRSAQTVGVITLERRNGPDFSASERELAASLGVLLGPVWALQQANERSLWQRLRDSARGALREWAGPTRPGLKLVGALAAATLLGLGLWTTEHRVAARTVVEGATQMAAVAPFDGFIAQGLARAGEAVRSGQPLARLDERDLRLERSRWQAEREQLQRRFQVAQSQADRAQMGVLAAQVHQAEAQLALAEERLARATVVAPFDGVVVSGDLSQQIGAPVEAGRLLFEVAPLQGYRVMMQVDDREITRIALEQRGELVLSGMPDTRLAITVKRITPVATQRDGRNVFAVEAGIEGAAPTGLRPGMEGVAKVVVGERSLLWIWTYGLFDALRLALWKWMP
jgi:biotin carboxyl carrier protein